MSLRTAAGGTVAGGGFQTDTGIMGTSHQQVLNTGGAMISEVNNLMSFLEGLDKSQWDGAAAAAFVNAKLQWQGTHVKLTNALSDIGTAIGVSGTAYTQAEDDTLATIRSAVSGLI